MRSHDSEQQVANGREHGSRGEGEREKEWGMMLAHCSGLQHV